MNGRIIEEKAVVFKSAEQALLCVKDLRREFGLYSVPERFHIIEIDGFMFEEKGVLRMKWPEDKNMKIIAGYNRRFDDASGS